MAQTDSPQSTQFHNLPVPATSRRNPATFISETLLKEIKNETRNMPLETNSRPSTNDYLPVSQNFRIP